MIYALTIDPDTVNQSPKKQKASRHNLSPDFSTRLGAAIPPDPLTPTSQVTIKRAGWAQGGILPDARNPSFPGGGSDSNGCGTILEHRQNAWFSTVVFEDRKLSANLREA
jgi:hypothetical protein